VILLPTHRSYLDFLLVSWVLFTFDLKMPHIAAGALIFWFVDLCMKNSSSLIFLFWYAGYLSSSILNAAHYCRHVCTFWFIALIHRCFMYEWLLIIYVYTFWILITFAVRMQHMIYIHIYLYIVYMYACTCTCVSVSCVYIYTYT